MTDKIIRIKIEPGDSKAQIDSLDKSMMELGQQTNETIAKTNAAGKSIESFGIRLSDADVALGRFIDKTGRVHEATGQFTSGFLASGQSVKEFAAQVNAASGLNTNLTKTSQGVKAALDGGNESLAGFGRSAGQAGIQIQQLVGQVQGGVSPFVALSQQAADLGFVLGFPLLGAVVGIGAALAGPLVAAFTQAEESADKFKETLKGIVDTQEELKANKAVAEINALNREFDKQQETITNLTRQQTQYIELIKQGGSAQASYAAALFQIDGQLDSAREKQQELAKKIEEVTSASLSNKATAAEQDDTLQRLNSTLEVQRIALEQGELQARLYAAAQALTLETTSDLPPAIREQITAIYELEQAQKAAKESAAALNREINSEAESDKQQAARAIRDQQRIDQRIANMRLETATLSSETVLQQAVLDERFSFEEAQLAAQTASRIMAATTEYDQLQALAGDDYARKLEAEIAFKEQIKAINEQYAMEQDNLTANSTLNQAQYAQQLRDIQFNSAATALSSISSFAKQGSALQKGLFIALKGVQAAQAYTSGLTAAMLARATIPYPYSEPIALAQISAGKISAAAIMATGLAGAFGGGGGSVGGGGGASIGSSSSPTLPTTPQSATTVGAFEIVGLAGLQDQLDRLDNDEVLPVSFTKRLVASLESVQRLQGA